MNYNEVIDHKIEELIYLLITNGVSPADLANNIFDENYSKISYYKKGMYIIGEIEFFEESDLVKMIYTYSEEKIVLKIEEQQKNQRIVLWDRASREKEIINEIIEFMKIRYTPEQMTKFISSLPNQIQINVQNELNWTA